MPEVLPVSQPTVTKHLETVKKIQGTEPNKLAVAWSHHSNTARGVWSLFPIFILLYSINSSILSSPVPILILINQTKRVTNCCHVYINM